MDRPLTLLQRRVLECVASGDANKQIAAELGISETGAKKHVEALRRRFGVTNRVALVRAALESGDLSIASQAHEVKPTPLRATGFLPFALFAGGTVSQIIREILRGT